MPRTVIRDQRSGQVRRRLDRGKARLDDASLPRVQCSTRKLSSSGQASASGDDAGVGSSNPGECDKGGGWKDGFGDDGCWEEGPTPLGDEEGR